ncbi:hypothetical protein DBL01_12610 [Acinetobacter pittii]|nr:hypothetical protein DBL01_12610 [Acinetobacter pittii]
MDNLWSKWLHGRVNRSYCHSTVNGSLTVVNYLLKNTVKGGTYTPAKLMGYKLVTELPDSGSLIVI